MGGKWGGVYLHVGLLIEGGPPGRRARGAGLAYALRDGTGRQSAPALEVEPEALGEG